MRSWREKKIVNPEEDKWIVMKGRGQSGGEGGQSGGQSNLNLLMRLTI